MTPAVARYLGALVVVSAVSIGAGGPTSRPGAWSTGVAVSPLNQPDPTRGSQVLDTAINASGLAAAAWDQFTYATGGPYTIGAAIRSSGRWGAPFTISGPAGFSMSPRVAVGDDGTIAIAWSWQDAALARQEIQAAVRPAGASTWTTAVLASGPLGGVAITPVASVGVDRAGNVTAAWPLWDGSRHLVQSATMLKGDGWSTAATVSGPQVDGLFVSLAVNALGDAAIAYTQSPYASTLTGTFAQVVSRTGPTGTWTAPITVSETMSPSVGYVTGPKIALDASGRATVLYMGHGLEAVREESGWTDRVVVVPRPTPVSSYGSTDLAVDDLGNALVAASVFDATVGVDRSSVWVSRFTGGAWTVAQRITDPTAPVDAYAARATVSPDGTLLLVGWIDHYHGATQVSRWTGSGWGGATTIGKGTAWSSFQEVLALDAGSAATACAAWKRAKGGTQMIASVYGR